jgi:hypothetical protein
VIDSVVVYVDVDGAVVDGAPPLQYGSMIFKMI